MPHVRSARGRRCQRQQPVDKAPGTWPGPAPAVMGHQPPRIFRGEWEQEAQQTPGWVGLQYSSGCNSLKSALFTLFGARASQHRACSTWSFTNQRLLVGEHAPDPFAANQHKSWHAQGQQVQPSGAPGACPPHVEEGFSSKTAHLLTEKCHQDGQPSGWAQVAQSGTSGAAGAQQQHVQEFPREILSSSWGCEDAAYTFPVKAEESSCLHNKFKDLTFCKHPCKQVGHLKALGT